MLAGHEGCVNSLSWSPDGRLLASGSDDLHLMVWRYPGGEAVARVQTQHADNIFASTWMGAERIVTTSRDGPVGVFRFAGGRLASEALCTCHRRSAMRVAVVEESVFLSASIDGTVRHHDLRAAHRCGEACANVVLSAAHEQIEWHALSVSAVRPELLAVGGNESTPLVFDRRMLPTASHARDRLLLGRAVWQLLPSIDACMKKPVSSVAWAPASTELAISYSKGPIYLVDPLQTQRYNTALHAASPLSPRVTMRLEHELYGRVREAAARGPRHTDAVLANGLLNSAARHGSYARHAAWRRLAGLELHNVAVLRCREGEYGQAERVLARALKLIEAPVPAECLALKQALLLQAEQRVPPAPPPAAELLDLLGSEALRRVHEAFVVGSHQAYGAHQNVQTIKDVAFAGTRGEFVVTGSDLGYFFLYDKATAAPVFIGHGDRDVTNVVQAHPHLPVLATSGIDATVKLWEPLAAAAGGPACFAVPEAEHEETLRDLQSAVPAAIGCVFQ